jgi:hypothetical protein
MKAPPKKKRLTFGDFIAGSYRAWGERQAKGMIRLAVSARWIEFRGPHRVVIS